MKPIFASYILEEKALRITGLLMAQSTDGTSGTLTPIPAKSLDTLRVELIEPNVSGARDLIKSGECTVDDNKVIVALQTGDWLKGGVYRLQMSAIFGTQTEVFFATDITVPRYTELADTEFVTHARLLVASTVGGGGSGSGADATVYALDGNDNAHITKPLTVSGSVREGQSTTAAGANSHAEGNGTTASGSDSHAEGNSTTASGAYSHAEGSQTEASQLNSHAEGSGTKAIGDYSHAEGHRTTAIGLTSHAEGQGTTASGNISHAEGQGTTASGNISHAEGQSTTASGANSHAEGFGTSASGTNSHAEGSGTKAIGDYSHAEGNGSVASQDSQHVCGQFNVIDTDNTYQFIVGNGTGNSNRHNAFAVTKSGELALFEADGTPVILEAAKLKALIANVNV